MDEHAVAMPTNTATAMPLECSKSHTRIPSMESVKNICHRREFARTTGPTIIHLLLAVGEAVDADVVEPHLQLAAVRSDGGEGLGLPGRRWLPVRLVR